MTVKDFDFNFTDIKAKALPAAFDKIKHDSESRLQITKLFLWAYFVLIAASFVFCYTYNDHIADLYLAATKALPADKTLPISDLPEYINVSQTVSLITATLSSGVGFVIGYYFKNGERNG